MDDFDKVKCAQLDMLIELKRICDLHGIHYFLVGGTLIGAVRHNGFIPWDDDVDVGMLRDDYNKFIEICANELNKDYGLFDWENDPNSPLPFLKIKIPGTHYREELSKDSSMNDALFIDIFPYDNAPDLGLLRTIQGIKNFFIKKIILLKCGFNIDKGGIIKHIVYYPLRFIALFGSINIWKERYARNALKYNKKNTECVVSLGGSYGYKRELKERSLFIRLTEMEFESVMFSVPLEYDRLLREIYGDYMQLPPESERISRHGISLIDFGDYSVKSSIRS